MMTARSPRDRMVIRGYRRVFHRILGHPARYRWMGLVDRAGGTYMEIVCRRCDTVLDSKRFHGYDPRTPGNA